MKKIIYLHGLESFQGGAKVEWMANHNLVFAPEMNYKDPELFQRILEQAKQLKPDLIVGSSMGGYFGWLLATHLNVPVLLFNPALHSRSIKIENATEGRYLPKGDVVLGAKDDTINPKVTTDMIHYLEKIEGKEGNIQIHTEPEMEHRTPLKVFAHYL
jgi:hypothetical protein|tara:strand:- start:534 stop:1007 length:474 start_codon:yes stop_codon:yes gene_type:complete